MLEMGEVQAAGKTLGLDTATFEIRRTEDFAPTFQSMKGRAQALYVVSVSTMHGFREYVEAGGLVSYGANFPHLWRRDYVDKIAGRIPPTCRLSSRQSSILWSMVTRRSN